MIHGQDFQHFVSKNIRDIFDCNLKNSYQILKKYS